MSTSILFHAFNLKGIKHTSTIFSGDTIIFRAEMDCSIKCPNCGKRHTINRGQKTRDFIMPPIGRKKCLLNLTLHRQECKECGNLWWPELSFMDGKHRYVRAFVLTVLDLLKFGTIQSVAEYMGVGWDMIKNIHKTKLTGQYRNIQIKKVKYIGIDEFSLKKGHNYMTIFTDLATGRIIHAVEGRSKEDIAPFLEKLAGKAYKLKAVSMDMSSSYFWAVHRILPHVDIVFDHYHVAALMNRAIDDLRRELSREQEKTEGNTLKGSRFLLLKNYDSLEDTKKERLDKLLDINQPLFIIHSMKEQLRLFWQKDDFESARSFLEIWIHDALESKIKQLVKVAKTISSYKTCLLNYFKHKITNGMVEGLNNKIKTLKRQAYGFRDMDYFKLRLYNLHTQKYSLSG